MFFLCLFDNEFWYNIENTFSLVKRNIDVGWQKCNENAIEYNVSWSKWFWLHIKKDEKKIKFNNDVLFIYFSITCNVSLQSISFHIFVVRMNQKQAWSKVFCGKYPARSKNNIYRNKYIRLDWLKEWHRFGSRLHRSIVVGFFSRNIFSCMGFDARCCHLLCAMCYAIIFLTFSPIGKRNARDKKQNIICTFQCAASVHVYLFFCTCCRVAVVMFGSVYTGANFMGESCWTWSPLEIRKIIHAPAIGNHICVMYFYQYNTIVMMLFKRNWSCLFDTNLHDDLHTRSH